MTDRQEAWVRFAAAALSNTTSLHPVTEVANCVAYADMMLIEFEKRSELWRRGHPTAHIGDGLNE